MIVNTIAQYKCLQWIMDRFNQDALNIEIADDVTLKITDQNKEQENEVIETNGYEAITHIQEFTSEEDAYEQLRIITEVENFEDGEEDEE